MSATTFTFDADNPLDLVDGESPKANAALTDYALLSHGRSLPQLADAYKRRPEAGQEKPPTRQLSTLKEWSAAYRWQDRVALYDRQQRLAQRTAVEHTWRERAQAERERTWNLAQQLQQRAEEMLTFPLAEIERETSREQTPSGEQIVNKTVIKPVRWGLRDAAQIIEIASKLARLSADLATEKVAIEDYQPRDLQHMSREQLLALKAEIERKKNG